MMYIVKNALKSITRAKGRNILIFVLVLMIAVSACVALSVGNSAEMAKETAYDTLSITAQITANRQGIMGSGGSRPGGGRLDPDSMMGQLSQSLTLDELTYFAKSEYADGFYYSSTVGVNVPEEFIIYENTSGGFGGGFGGGCGGILIIFNMFTARERKYEIGVLAAIGMKKGKVAMQFLTEAFIVTFIAIIVGTGIGAVASEPVGDYMLKEQVASMEITNENTNQNFGGGFQGNMGGFRPGGNMGGNASQGNNANHVDYVVELNTTTDFTVTHSPDVAKMSDVKYELAKYENKNKFTTLLTDLEQKTTSKNENQEKRS